MDGTDKALLWTLGVMIFLATIGITFIFLFSTPTKQDNKEKTCEDLGGKYMVVDKQWIGKANYMDIYGCVK